MKLFFARHGESEANVLHVVSNRELPHGLTAVGRQQATALANRLKDSEVSQIFTSPILRAVQTTEILAAELGLSYTVTDALREYDCGILEGRSDEETWRRHSELAEDWVVRRQWERKLEGGESFFDIRNRFAPFIDSLICKPEYAEQAILLLGHGGTLRMMLPLILSNVDQGFVEAHPLAHTTCVVAEQCEDRLQCLQWGDITFS